MEARWNRTKQIQVIKTATIFCLDILLYWQAPVIDLRGIISTGKGVLLISVFSIHLVWLHQTRIGLSLYDVAGQGYLRESVRI